MLSIEQINAEALDDIVEAMDGTEWSADTLEAIAGILEGAGFELGDSADGPIGKQANSEEARLTRLGWAP